MNLKQLLCVSRTCYYFNDIIKFEDFDFDNILLDEKLYKNILIRNTSYKTLIGANLCALCSIKQMVLLETMMNYSPGQNTWNKME